MAIFEILTFFEKNEFLLLYPHRRTRPVKIPRDFERSSPIQITVEFVKPPQGAAPSRQIFCYGVYVQNEMKKSQNLLVLG